MTDIFNIRVYGLVLNHENQVLVSDEYIYGRYITKFPGGGLEFGEGTIDCLRREFREEMAMEIENIEHFFTTDFFQVSFLNPKHQVISIYYFASLKYPGNINVKTKVFDFDEVKEGMQSFRWLSISGSKEEDLTFPIDRKVLQLLKARI